MSWQILRKDLVLLWPLVALSALAQWGLDVLMLAADRTPDSHDLLSIARLFVLVVVLAIALAISQAVHQDPIPGTRQDWLIRPIRRRDVLLAKLLFVLAAVQLPMLLGDVLEMIAQGFSFSHAAMAALSRNLVVFVALSLPGLGFAAITRNTAQFVGIAIAYFLAIAGATFLFSVVSRNGGANPATNPIGWTAVAWVPQALAPLMLAAGALVALFLLYVKRRIALAHCLFPMFAVLSALATILPWGWVFALEKAAAGPPVVNAVKISIDPEAPRYRPAAGESLDDYTVGNAQVELRGRSPGDIETANRTRRAEHDVTILIPIRMAGLPAGALPWVDRAVVILRRQDGQVVFQGRGDDLKLDETQTGSSPALAYVAVRMHGSAYEALKDTAVTAEVDYSLSVLRPRQPVEIAALDARAHLPGFGQCTTDRDSDGDDVELRCLQAGEAPSCIAATLQDPATGRRNPETRICAPNYAPYDPQLFPDAIRRFQVEAPFRDRLQLRDYPVGGAELGHAMLVLTRYDASQHVSGRVTANPVRLASWAPLPAPQ